ncbi:MAG: hypothetical protein WC360_05735, partial [Opitutales bacterium]
MIAKNGDAILSETWTLLYKQAEKLRKMQPWKKMYDSELFGVEDAESGQIVWFSVLGALRQMFSLAVYVGDPGLDYFLYQSSRDWETNPQEQVVLKMNCMSVEFVPKSELSEFDIETQKAASFTPSARARIAQFRSTHKGYAPWYLEADEAALLARVMQIAVNVIGILMKDKQIIEKAHEDGTPPYYAKNKNGEWRLKWLDISEPVEIAPGTPLDLCEFEAAEIKQSAKHSEDEWHIGFAMLGGYMGENDQRPYPAGAFLCVDVATEFLFSPVVYQPGTNQETQAAQT